MANTKLSPIQKAANKACRAEFTRNGGYIFHYEVMGVCVVMRRTGKEMAKFSVSIKSPEEKKYRKSVAEYHAFSRGFQPCRIGPQGDTKDAEYFEMSYMAHSIATSVIY